MSESSEQKEPRYERSPPLPVVACLAGLLVAATLLIVVLDLALSKYELVRIPFVWDMFAIEQECNLPTWYASILWFVCAGAAVRCWTADKRGGKDRRFSWMWLMIALVFLCASADEVARIHEHVGSYLLERLDKQPHQRSVVGLIPPDSPWLFFYGPVVAGFFLSAGSFLWKRLSGRNGLKLLLIFALEGYLLALGLDFYQGLPEEKAEEIAARLEVRPLILRETSFVVEEALENLSTSAVLLVFLIYGWPRQRS